MIIFLNTKNWFGDYKIEYPLGNIQEAFNKILKIAIEEAFNDVKNNKSNSWLGAGEARGGFQPVGGITWLDWNEEFYPIPNVNQIVGHTTFYTPQEYHTENSLNYNIDTKNRHIGILENGKFSWIENKFI
jgi:hypothetical protein